MVDGVCLCVVSSWSSWGDCTVSCVSVSGQSMVTGRCGHRGVTARSVVALVKDDGSARVQILDLSSTDVIASAPDNRRSTAIHTAVQVNQVVLRRPRPLLVLVNHSQLS